jgi:hypothetical protein
MTEGIAISLDVKLTRHAKRGDGGLNLGFAVHPHGMPREIADAQLGDLFKMVLVPVDENDAPVQWKRGTSAPRKSADTVEGSPASSPNTESPQHEDPGPRSQGRGVSPEKRLVQQAAMCCSDPVFCNYLIGTHGAFIGTEEDAAAFVRDWCGVASRSQILLGTQAASRWDRLYSQFVAWREAAS